MAVSNKSGRKRRSVITHRELKNWTGGKRHRSFLNVGWSSELRENCRTSVSVILLGQTDDFSCRGQRKGWEV